MATMNSYPTVSLATSPLFATRQEYLDKPSRIRLSHQRSKAIVDAYKLQVDDVKNMTAKFWQFHADPILFRDIGTLTNLTIQYNPALGTLIDLGSEKPEFQPLIRGILKYTIQAQFLLTEFGHGLDVVNMETRATLLPTGEFDLHSPSNKAAKFMSSTIPAGIPCIGIVFARLFVNREDRGVRPFVVQLNDGTEMCRGVRAKLLPPRDDTDSANHSLTTFDHVLLPPSSILGSLEMPFSKRLQFLSSIRRVTVGSMVIAMHAVPSLKLAAYIVGKYSQRRMVQAGAPQPMPIISFRTQQLPILTALADALVFEAFKKRVLPLFLDPQIESDVFRALAAICKVVMLQHHQNSVGQLINRCGAQGVFRYNGLTSAYNVIRGYSIGEGDTLVLSIRLATELLLGRYQVPSTSNPTSLLAKHESGLFISSRTILSRISSHRSEEFNRLIIPHCQSMVETIGHRMAYDAAVAERLPQPFIDLFEANAVKSSLAWFVANGLLTQDRFQKMEDDAVRAAYPLLRGWLESDGNKELGDLVHIPIVSDEAWHKFQGELALYEGNAVAEQMSMADPKSSARL